MMSPPERRNGPDVPAEAESKTVAATPHTQDQPSASRRWCVRRPADLFREGFRRGFHDALRLASRAFDDPHSWAVLSQLADRYEADA